MLYLTRKLNEQIRIGKVTTLTVMELLPGKIILRMESPGIDISAPIVRGHRYAVEIDSHNVSVQLETVVRGECRLGFDAPRSVRIINAERLEAEHGR